jgi:hypothetical protein
MEKYHTLQPITVCSAGHKLSLTVSLYRESGDNWREDEEFVYPSIQSIFRPPPPPSGGGGGLVYQRPRNQGCGQEGRRSRGEKIKNQGEKVTQSETRAVDRK